MKIEFRERHLMLGFTPSNETFGAGAVHLIADTPGEELACEALGDYLMKAEQRGELGAAIELLLSILTAERKGAEGARVLSPVEMLKAGAGDCESPVTFPLGKIWKAAPALIFSGKVEDYDAGDFGMTVLRDEETGRGMFGEFLYDYMGKQVKAVLQILEPAPGGEE